MSLRIQSTADVVKLETAKATWSGTPMPSVAPDAEVGVTRKSPSANLTSNPNANPSFTAKKEVVNKDTVESAVESINGAIEHINRGLRFSVHEDTQRMMVQVVDVVTQEVIKEIPPEDVLDTAARIREAIGLLIDERA